MRVRIVYSPYSDSSHSLTYSSWRASRISASLSLAKIKFSQVLSFISIMLLFSCFLKHEPMVEVKLMVRVNGCFECNILFRSE
jgi:hypothetical protein